MFNIFLNQPYPKQWGSTPRQPVLQAATMVKILTEKKLKCPCIYFAIVRFIAEISLDLDQLDRRYSGLTVD